GKTVNVVLSPGDHTVQARVTDAGGLSDTSTVNVTVEADVDIPPPVGNTAPVVNVSAPGGNSAVAGQIVTLSGTGSDTEDGDISSQLSWTSSIDGVLSASGGLVNLSLSVGSHTITASVIDSGGLAGSASIGVTIEPANTQPVVSISAPEGTSVTEGETLDLVGSASDMEDGNISSELSWSSSKDGNLPVSGSNVNLSLSLGTHTITASVTDSGTLTGSDSITITVREFEETLAAFYVDRNHPQASDTNPGTEDEPWQTMVHAAETVSAGETVYVKAGVYNEGDVEFANSGTAGSEIVFAAYPGDERLAILDSNRVEIVGVSHVTVRGIRVQNSDDQGFYIRGPDDPFSAPTGHITISGNHTFNTYSSGIAVWGVPWSEEPGDFNNLVDIVIEGNLIEMAVNGGSNECITVSDGVSGVDVNNNEIRLGGNNDRGGEGIDFKNGVRDSQIRNNYIHGLSRRAIYIDGGDKEGSVNSNIRIHGNVLLDDPDNAIMIMSEGVGDVDGIYIYNNLIVNPNKNGISIWEHPDGVGRNTINNIQIVNNTVIHGGHQGGGWGNISNKHESATNVLIRNNVTRDGYQFDIKGTDLTTIDNNLCRDSFCEIQDDPEFVNATLDPNTWDYHLKSTSPAIDAGVSTAAPAKDLDGNSRPQGSAYDMGAYEHTP
ncbi:MAG: choice-of-anchor Q domain-containing protein, partial [Gammaproteobacteria bacterium]